jgi:hypothetical protein
MPIMLSVVAECQSVQCRYTECRGAIQGLVV